MTAWCLFLQLMFHGIGDYVTQTNWMAELKRRFLSVALLHAVVYGLPFLVFKPSALAWWVLVFSHALIDHYGVARFVIYAKENAPLPWGPICSLANHFPYGAFGALRDYHRAHPRKPIEDCPTGYDPSVKAWQAVWLMIIVDNLIHVAVNALCLRYL